MDKKLFIAWWPDIRRRVELIAGRYVQPADAEDIVQAVALRMFQRRKDLGSQDELKKWALKCAVWLSLDMLRAKRRKKWKNATDWELDVNAFESVVGTSESKSALEEVLKLIKELPPKQKQVMELSLEGHSAGEIGARTNPKMAANTVRSHKRHAINRLAKWLGVDQNR